MLLSIQNNLLFKGIGYHINYPVFANFQLFLFYTQDEAVAMCLETCVKISYKSDKNEKVITYTI